MDRSGSLLERDVVGEDAEGVAVEERMTEHGVFEPGAGESGEDFRALPCAILCSLCKKIGGDNIDGIADFNRGIFKLGMVGDGHVGRDRPRGGGPDEAVDAAYPRVSGSMAAGSEVSAKRTQMDGLEWLAYSTSASARAVRSWMHQLTGLSPL